MRAQETKSRRELYYTYAGPVLSGGMNNIRHAGWFDTQQETKEYSGYFFSGGACLAIQVGFLLGRFSFQYMYNANDLYPVSYLFYTVDGSYVYEINQTFGLTAGLGMYFDTPPSNKNYTGSAGLDVPLGVMINTTFDTKLFFDIFARYGFYGLGDGSTKLSYGINLAFVFKVGRI